ncbi:glycosyltransferase [Thermosulfurimonas sp. F29]|uniref:MraY family glycosyltransferase n=1 Tax=Thermosulfurimonas sp. F29 TaxID=2867247 RepID=UPI001C8334D0|nr:glycosyltransferase [Thermosulfurimonas sp. F29]MBX6423266.1 glycosyltransferase [Thermosulfurimonas sp. F29]
MKYLLLAFLGSTILNVLVIRLFRLEAFCDSCEGVQKFHRGSVPRVGGVCIYLALWGAGGLFALAGKPFAREFLLFLVAALPVFLSGLAEDVTKGVGPGWRLLAGFLSGALACLLVSARIPRVEVPGFDLLLRHPWFSLLFTAFAVAGVSHAFNIIDGFNGLASGVAMMVFGAYAYVAFLLHDQFLTYLGLVMLFATLGFFLWNYPFGFIFLGDGGAYLLGYGAAVCGVLLVARHPQVSPWFPLVLVIYPVWETLFSIYRKKFLRGISPAFPDGLHFHMLIYKRLVKLTFGSELEALKRNAFTSPYLWIMQLVCVGPGVLFWRNTTVLVLFVLGFVAFYTWLYFRIVRFRTPGFLRKIFVRGG